MIGHHDNIVEMCVCHYICCITKAPGTRQMSLSIALLNTVKMHQTEMKNQEEPSDQVVSQNKLIREIPFQTSSDVETQCGHSHGVDFKSTINTTQNEQLDLSHAADTAVFQLFWK